MPRSNPAGRALLPLGKQNAYRERYRAMRPGWRPSGEELEALVRGHLTAQSRVLDLGSGRGGLVESLWREVELAAGLDPDLSSLAEHRARGMPLICGRGEQMPFAAESFDLVVCLWVLEHVEHPTVVLREVRRVLRPGGHFVFLTPNLRNPLLLMNRLARALPQLQRRIVPRLYGRLEADTFPVRYRANTEAAIRSLSAECGLDVATLKSIPDPTYVALNDLMFRASAMSDRVLPQGWGVHLLGDLTPSRRGSRPE
jgi:2-polyprenyl-3-methyl-5-hydroxy-6-metoxy-1,4-benzoquinol methylase